METRAEEIVKYEEAYLSDNYKMGPRRHEHACEVLRSLLNGRTMSYLDVGCGRGEMIVQAKELGFYPAHGLEAVDYLTGGDVFEGLCHELPFPDCTYDVITMFDVIEHLPQGDDELACRELDRVAKRHVVLTANNQPSYHLNRDLHINIRPYEEWDRLFREWFSGEVTWLNRARNISETWRVDY